MTDSTRNFASGHRSVPKRGTMKYKSEIGLEVDQHSISYSNVEIKRSTIQGHSSI